MSASDSFHTPEQHPESRARRRRARRTFFPADAEGREAMLAELASRSYPTYELYILSLLCGVILAAGFSFDSQGLLIFGALSAPILSVWMGVSLATIIGPLRYFAQTFSALLISALLVFAIGLGAGFFSRAFQPITLTQVYMHSRLWWPDLLVLAVGAVVFTSTFVRSERRPIAASVMLAYEFFLPLSAAGFGLGAGLEGIWPQAVLVTLVYFSWATLFSLLTLFALRFRPLSFGGFVFSGLVTLVILFVLGNYMGLTGLINSRVSGQPATLAPSPTASETATLAPLATGSPTPSLTPSPTGTSTPIIETNLVPPTLLGGDVTFPATETPVPTITFEPTPIYAKVSAIEGGGAFMRKTPGVDFLATLENGVIVEVLGETQERSGVTWIKVAAIKNGLRMEGWVIQSVLATATPVVNWQPSSTPVFTPTP